MKIGIVKTSISKEKLLKGDFTPDTVEIIDYKEVDEDEFYMPLVAFLYEKLKEEYKEKAVNN